LNHDSAQFNLISTKNRRIDMRNTCIERC